MSWSSIWASPLIESIKSRHSIIRSIVRARARKIITPVLNHADASLPDWWPQFLTVFLRGLRSASQGTCRQSVPESTSASGTDCISAYGVEIHAASTSDMHTSRPLRSSQMMTAALVTPYSRKAPVRQRNPSI